MKDELYKLSLPVDWWTGTFRVLPSRVLPSLTTKIIHNPPATIVFWGDGTKTVVKAHNEPYDKEKGVVMAYAKHSLGSNYKKLLKMANETDLNGRLIFDE